MANTIKLKKDGTSSATPTVNSDGSADSNGLVPGELAINYRDGKLYFAKYNGSTYSREYFPDSSQSTSPSITTSSNGGGSGADNSILLYNGTGDASVDSSANLTFTGSALQLTGTFTVGVNDTGHDVTFFGAGDGGYLKYVQSADALEVRGSVGNAGGTLNLTTGEETIVADNQLGRIRFSAPAETGADAVLVGAEILAEAQEEFTATANHTDLIFKVSDSEAASEKFRLYGNNGKAKFTNAVGIGTVAGTTSEGATATTKFQVRGDGADEALMTIENVSSHAAGIELLSGHGNWGVYNSDTVADALELRDDSAGATRLLIDSSGNVGIGTTSPAHPLHVHKASGNLHLRMSAADDASNSMEFVNASGNTVYCGMFGDQTGGAGKFGVYVSGFHLNVDSNGTLSLPTANVYIANSSGHTLFGSDANDQNMSFAVGGSGTFEFNARVNISSDAQVDSLYIGGGGQNDRLKKTSSGSGNNALWFGNAQILSASDVRLKKDITDTTFDALGQLNKCRVVDFTWDDPSDLADVNKNSRGKWTGLIAQEVVEHIPFAVNAVRDIETNALIPDSKQTNDDGEEVDLYWGMEYDKIVPVLIKAVQELSAKITALENA